MNTFRRIGIALVCLGLAIGAAGAGVGVQRTIYVQPAAAAASQDVGNWGVTANGNGTHFGFAIPADLDSIDQVVVVTIGKSTKDYTFDQLLSVASDDAAQDGLTTTILDTPAQSVTGIVDELDVTGIFNTFGLGSGDYVTLEFTAAPATAIHILGLRFEYTDIAGGGPPGPPGFVGPPGPTGPIGPTGDGGSANVYEVICADEGVGTGPPDPQDCSCFGTDAVLTGGVVCHEGAGISLSRPLLGTPGGWQGSCHIPCTEVAEKALGPGGCGEVVPAQVSAICFQSPGGGGGGGDG